jgi:Xaa-Pro dipeptidase
MVYLNGAIEPILPRPWLTKDSTLVPAETLLRPSTETSDFQLQTVSDRRADVDAKTARVAALLQAVGCEGLLLFEPENLAWLSSGATIRGLPDPAAAPAVYCNGEGRWLIARNLDSQRLFDEELDGLGFQLKEWPWHWGQEQLLADLCQNRRVASDRPFDGCHVVADPIRRLRRELSLYEQACLLTLGLTLSHALEATCRDLEVNDTEREAAGRIGHRLMHRGALPVYVGAAADGRSRAYKRFGFTSTSIRRYVVLTATARKYGLCATASRAVSFGEPDADFQKEHNAVCRVSASFLASTWPDAVPREILTAGRRIYLISGFEHEWLLAPQGWLTGRAPVEETLTPQTEELFQAGWAVTWSPSAGAASGCDTFLITDKGPTEMTPSEAWPLKRIKIQGAEFTRPDVLQR